jgi:hypothetical protein
VGQKILLINPKAPPSKRRKSSTKGKTAMAAARKKRRTPKQIAATKRLIAFNRSRRKSPAKRRRNPVGASNASAYRAVATMSNPIRKRRSRPRVSKAAATQAGRTLRYRRRNPINKTLGILQNSLMGSVWGAGGAVAVDAVAAALPLPDIMRTGYLKYVTKGLLSAALGAGAGYVIHSRNAEAMAAGGLTVALHGAMTEFVKTNVPAMNLGYYSSSLPADKTHSLGAYVAGKSAPNNVAQLGAYVAGGNRYAGRGNRGR